VENTVGKLIAKIKILDPACGSGSFLIGAYTYLLRYHLDWYVKNLSFCGALPLDPASPVRAYKKALPPKFQSINNHLFWYINYKFAFAPH
jgi:type II restriction/modification system DNA methylase subunit YeeA